jgi:hypothetical protein
MDVYIHRKSKGKDKEQKTHYPKCPSCGNENYLKLSVCHECSILTCEQCKEKHN